MTNNENVKEYIPPKKDIIKERLKDKKMEDPTILMDNSTNKDDE